MSMIRLLIWVAGAPEGAWGAIAHAPATSPLRLTFWIAWVIVWAAALVMVVARERPLFPK